MWWTVVVMVGEVAGLVEVSVGVVAIVQSVVVS